MTRLSVAGMLKVDVSDPEKHGTSSSLPQNHFVDFKIHTVTDQPRFASRDFFVRRRYRDFVWLRAQLAAGFPGAIVPPLPSTESVKEDRFSTKFIQRRQAGLELFLRRVAVHGQLSTSADLLTFLEAKVWELQTAKNSSVRSWTSDLLDGTDASMKRAAAVFRTKVPDDDGVEKLRSFASEYHSVVSAAETAHRSTVNALADAAGDLSHLGPAVDLLSQSETELSLPFTHMASALGELNELYLKRVQTEHVSGLSSLLTFNSGMAASLKEILKNRDHALAQYQKATALLDARSSERQKWQTAQENAPRSPGRSSRASAADGDGERLAAPSSSSSRFSLASMRTRMEELIDDPNKGQKLQAKVAEAERALEEAKARWEAINESVEKEAAEFHRSTNADFSRGLREHIEQQVAFEQAQQAQWREVLRIFEAVPATMP